jgi:Mg-chelatase subunit ChlD
VSKSVEIGPISRLANDHLSGVDAAMCFLFIRAAWDSFSFPATGNLAFAAPASLALFLFLLPVIWWARRSWATLGTVRRGLAIGLRMALIVLVVLALAETQLRQETDRLCVLYLLDQSGSIPREQREAMFAYVQREIAAHRENGRGDSSGIIVFGREAAVEIPPTEDDWGWVSRRESLIPNLEEATDLSAAMKLAVTIFPPDAARRIVIVSDGNENRGSAADVAAEFEKQGIGIDTIAVSVEGLAGVTVERLNLPPRAKQDSMVDARVVLNHRTPAVGPSSEPAPAKSGTLRITRRLGSDTEVLVSEQVQLPPGKTVLSFPHRLERGSGFYTYEAEFLPDDDGALQPNSLAERRATNFVNVTGQGRVLFLENPETAGSYAPLVQRLRAANLAVDVRSDGALFSSFAELQSYDTVVMADLPRTAGGDESALISDQQVELLVRNTELGCGLVLLGGPNSFGAGGWSNTRLEEASPVHFTVKNSKVMPRGALVIVCDRSGSMAGDKIVAAKQAALAAIQALGDNDQVGVVTFDSSATWTIPFQKIAGRRDVMRSLLRRVSADGGTNAFPGMAMGFQALKQADASVKHMIVLTDGQTPPADFDNLLRSMRSAGITVSTVAVGPDADRDLLSRLARLGAGRFYNVAKSGLVPKIFIKEAMRVTRPLIYEREAFEPQWVGDHEALAGLGPTLPPIRGFVLTEVKDSPLVQVGIKSPYPSEEDLHAIMASWNYGIGRSVVITTDAGQRWATPWLDWDQYARFYEQVIRWSMRPGGVPQNINVAAQVVDGRLQASLTASDESGQPLNALQLLAFVVKPDQSVAELNFRQISPGRYRGEIPAETAGSYFLSVRPGLDHAAVTVGVNAAGSAELTDSRTNWNLLRQLANQVPAGGSVGRIREDGLTEVPVTAADDHSFRKTLAKSFSLQDIRPLLIVLASLTLFMDVLVRRVSWDFGSRPVSRERLLANKAPTGPAATVDRLQAAVAQLRQVTPASVTAPEIASQSANRSSRWVETPPEEASSGPRPGSAVAPSPENSAADYTARLLEAKRRSQKP